jgi:predicted metal-dependent hydrolase
LLGDREVPFQVARRKGAVNMILRFDAASDEVRLVLPCRVSLAEGMDFVESRKDWLHQQMIRLPPRIPFAHGERIPFQGIPHLVRHAPEARRGVWIEDNAIHVSGSPEHLPRRLGDFLKEQARKHITHSARDKAQEISAEIGRIAMKDTKARWGSCTPYGDLSFSWRLVLAPPFVLDYVVAHEVAHLRHLNHGARFWRQVAKLTEHTAEAKSWLRRHGAALHRYG